MADANTGNVNFSASLNNVYISIPPNPTPKQICVFLAAILVAIIIIVFQTFLRVLYVVSIVLGIGALLVLSHNVYNCVNTKRTHRYPELTHDRTGTSEVFICHASEDKERFVRPLVEELIVQGVPESAIFYDELSLKTGDKLKEKIPNTLRSASLKLFVFVISDKALGKPWPKYECSFANVLKKRIFPIWLGENGENWDKFKEKVDGWHKLADLTDVLAERVKVEEIKDKLSEITKKIKSELDSLRESKKDL